jgi:hypothetical protein
MPRTVNTGPAATMVRSSGTIVGGRMHSVMPPRNAKTRTAPNPASSSTVNTTLPGFDMAQCSLRRGL